MVPSEATADLYDRYGGMLYGVALRILGEPADAADVLQQVWLQWWRTRDLFNPKRGTPAAWLVTMVRSRALDRRRSLNSRRRAESSMPAPVPRPSQDPVQRLDDVQRHARVRRALEEIDPRWREVLELAFFEGMTQSEVAAHTRYPLGTVKTWCRRGLLALRERLAGEAAS